jgi:uncharacterized OB-fold protein
VTGSGSQPPAELPRVIRDAGSEEFFEATAQGILLIRKCKECGHFNEPGASACQRCRSADLAWSESAGAGEVVACGVVHKRQSSEDPARPSVVAIVELDEGPWLYGRFLHGSMAIAPGTRVRVELTQTGKGEGEAIPFFAVSS